MNEGGAAAIQYPLEGVTYARHEQARRWIASGDWLDQTVGEALAARAGETPDKPAFISEARTLSFAELHLESDLAAAAFLGLGLQPGDRVIVQLGTSIDTVVALAGLYKAGLIPVCAIPQYRELEIGQLARLAAPRAHLVQAQAAGFDLCAFAARIQSRFPTIEHVIVAGPMAGGSGTSLDRLIPRQRAAAARAAVDGLAVGAGDVLSFQLSGGTTGVPKIIPRFHAEYLGHALGAMRRFGFGRDDSLVWPLPILHNAGQVYGMMSPITFGSTLVLIDGISIPTLFRLIELHRVTHAISVGPIAAQILTYDALGSHDYSSLKMFATLNNAAELEARLGTPCLNFYGITEGLVLGSAPDEPAALRHRTHGTPPGASHEIRLVDPETGKAVRPGESGELVFRGPSSLRGYYRDPVQTRAAMTEDGWFRSGDIMQAVEAGPVTGFAFKGRNRDNINRGGEKISCEEVEALVHQHPAIAEARVVAMPDALLGERACLFVIPRPAQSPPSVEALCDFLTGKGIAKFKCPERIEAIDAFPVTRVGKLDRAELRSRIARLVQGEARLGAQGIASR